MLTHQSFIRITLVLAVLLCGASLAPGQAQFMNNPQESNKTKRITYPFDVNDRIDGMVGAMKKTYFLGEPIIVPIKLANHTRYPITLECALNPRAGLKVMIRPEGDAQFRYNGPYLKGYYGPTPFFMYPFDEVQHNLVIWSDLELPGRLALAKPGNYTFNVSVMVKVTESPIPEQELKLEGGTFTVTVVPTPKPLEPLIELFKQGDNLLYLQLHKIPAIWGPKTIDILNQYPQTMFTPWLCYSLGTYYYSMYEEKPSREAADNALKFYTFAAKSDSPFRDEIYRYSLLPFMDKLDLTRPAAVTAAEFLSKLPEERRGRIGNDELLQKYLVNTTELDPIKYWAFLP